MSLYSYASPAIKSNVTARLPNHRCPTLNLPLRLVEAEKQRTVEGLMGTEKTAGTLGCHAKMSGSGWSEKDSKIAT